MKNEQSHNDDKQIDKFAEMLSVMDSEHLLRFRKRLEKVGKKEMVRILTEEIKTKEAAEKKDEDDRRARLEEQVRKDKEARK